MIINRELISFYVSEVLIPNKIKRKMFINQEKESNLLWWLFYFFDSIKSNFVIDKSLILVNTYQQAVPLSIAKSIIILYVAFVTNTFIKFRHIIIIV